MRRASFVLIAGLVIASAACNRPKSVGSTETTSGNLDIGDARTPAGFVRAKKAYAVSEANIADADRRLHELELRAATLVDGRRRVEIKAAVANARAQREVFRRDGVR